MASDKTKARLPLMLADATLGRLCKWLRMMGIDTQMDTAIPDPKRLESLRTHNRWVLTRSQKVSDYLGPDRCLLVRSSVPVEQVRQVLRDFDIQHPDLLPLSRCIPCNQLLSRANMQELTARVPDHIRQSNVKFLKCTRCKRIYWPGTHTGRMHSMIRRWFRQGPT